MKLRSLKSALTSCTFALAAGIAVPASAHTAALQTETVSVPGITLDDGVTPIGINLSVHTRENRRCQGPFGTLIALHGFAFNAASLEPLAEAVVTAKRPHRSRSKMLFRRKGICRVVAIDMPGHGALPAASPDIDLDDYVSVLDQVLKTLPALGLSGHHVMGHSMGGGLLWMLQERLVAEGSSILREYFIPRVTLVAPVPPEEVGWDFAFFARANLFNSFFITNGLMSAPPPTWPQFFFVGLDETTTPVRPDDADIATWVSSEPEAVARQLFGYVGALDLSPEELSDPAAIFGGLPSASPGIFAPSFFQRCAVNIVGYEGDSLISLDEVRATYEHLTGDTTGACLTEITGTNTVHETHIADPELLIDQVLTRAHRSRRSRR